jgi:hypothetical protein
MTIEGTIIFISEETLVWQKQLPKVSFVIEEDSDREFKNSLMIDLLWDKVELIKQYNVWDHVKVSLNYRAREYDGRRFNSIWARKIEGNGWTSANGWDELPF